MPPISKTSVARALRNLWEHAPSTPESLNTDAVVLVTSRINARREPFPLQKKLFRIGILIPTWHGKNIEGSLQLRMYRGPQGFPFLVVRIRTIPSLMRSRSSVATSEIRNAVYQRSNVIAGARSRSYAPLPI